MRCITIRSFSFRVSKVLLRLADPILRGFGYDSSQSRLSHELPTSSFYRGESALQALLGVHRGYLTSSGWLETKNRNRSFSRGEWIPWITFPAIALLDRWNLGKKKYLEFGGGASTFWFAKRAESVVTVEVDQGYLDFLQSAFTDFENVTLLRLEIEKEVFSAALVDDLAALIRDADLILIDGGNRNQLIEVVSRVATSDSVIIVDNSDWVDHLRVGLASLRSHGWVEIPFRGLGPLNSYESQTSVFVKDLTAIVRLER